MLEVNAVLFWGLCLMAAVGVVQAILTLIRKEPERHWTEPTYAPPGTPPPGFRWVLVKEDEIPS